MLFTYYMGNKYGGKVKFNPKEQWPKRKKLFIADDQNPDFQEGIKLKNGIVHFLTLEIKISLDDLLKIMESGGGFPKILEAWAFSSL